MLEKVTHIEGLADSYENVEMVDDTAPGGVKVRFHVEAVEMPYLTEHNPDGNIVYKNFVMVTKEWELGRSKFTRRVRDNVVFDESKQKWEIKKLLGAGQSDVRKNPAEWNAFIRNASQDVVGTPLLVLFKNDPSRTEQYKTFGIYSVEHLAGLNDTDAANLGAGGREDKQKAITYLQKLKASAPSMNMKAIQDEFAEREAALKRQIDELSARLVEVVEKKEATPKAPIAQAKKTNIKEKELGA